MSFSEQRAESFFGPLIGRTTTFLLEGRQTNLEFARTITGFLAQTNDACTIMDLDAFYSSNADRILLPLNQESAKSTTIRVPEPGSDIEVEFSRLFEAQQKLVVIDSLNSLYHLISMEDGSSRTRKLTFAVASLSYFARTNGKAVILMMYRREGFNRTGTGRSISSLSDVTASVEIRGQELTVRVERGHAWPGGSFLTRIP
jgi:hypothetical protein